MWLEHPPSFKANISSWWNVPAQEKWEGYRFMGKLRAVKGNLRIWNREVFGDVKTRKERDS